MPPGLLHSTGVIDVRPPDPAALVDPIAARFFTKVTAVPAGEAAWNRGCCWQWTAYRRDGYGVFWPEPRTEVAAHRWSWQHVYGTIPAGLTLDHLCHDPDVCPDWRQCEHRGCVRPDHLGLVSRSANGIRNQSPPALNARMRTCRQGHPLAGANLYVRMRRGRPRRVCRTCQAEYWRRWNRRLSDTERERGDDRESWQARYAAGQAVLF